LGGREHRLFWCKGEARLLKLYGKRKVHGKPRARKGRPKGTTQLVSTKNNGTQGTLTHETDERRQSFGSITTRHQFSWEVGYTNKGISAGKEMVCSERDRPGFVHGGQTIDTGNKEM